MCKWCVVCVRSVYVYIRMCMLRRRRSFFTTIGLSVDRTGVEVRVPSPLPHFEVVRNKHVGGLNGENKDTESSVE